MNKRGRGRPRREGADAEILAAAREMLAEVGYRDLTVDAVAERVGVAKTTVYRRWPTKAALVASLLEPILRETEQVLADAKSLQDIRAALLPRRVALTEILGDEDEADRQLGALLMRALGATAPR